MLVGFLFLLFASVFGEEKVEKVDGPVIGIDLGTTYSMCSFLSLRFATCVLVRFFL